MPCPADTPCFGHPQLGSLLWRGLEGTLLEKPLLAPPSLPQPASRLGSRSPPQACFSPDWVGRTQLLRLSPSDCSTRPRAPHSSTSTQDFAQDGALHLPVPRNLSGATAAFGEQLRSCLRRKESMSRNQQQADTARKRGGTLQQPEEDV